MKNSGLPAIVFIHQNLDGTGKHFVNNAAEVRKVLEAYGITLAVFQGHDNEGRYSEIEGIHYYTLRAMVEGSGLENNAYASVKRCAGRHNCQGLSQSSYPLNGIRNVSDLKGTLRR